MNFLLKNKNLEVLLLVFGGLCVVIYHLPYLFYGENSHILIHDNLDSNVAWVKMFIENTSIFNNPNKIINQPLSGLPQSSLFEGYKISLIWFHLFGVFWGYVVNKFVMSLVAYFGMYFLLKEFDIDFFIAILVSVIFSFLPFWGFTLSISGLPLLLYLFLAIKNNKDQFYHWIILFVFPFYSSLIFSIIFFLLLIFILFFLDVIEKKSISKKFFFSIAIFGLLFLISEFPLFYSFFTVDNYLSHRLEFTKETLSFVQALNESWWVFSNGQFHAPTYHKYFYIIFLFFGIIKIIKKEEFKKAIYLVLIIILGSLFYGFSRHPFFYDFIRKSPIQLDRFYTLFPLLWYVLLALSLDYIYKITNKKIIVILFIIFIPLKNILKKHELLTNRNHPTFKQFYSVNLFNDIKKYIKTPIDEYKVINVGIHPSISQYNGFYTLDGYFTNYPLEYKHQFRKIISKELEKSPSIKKYFDNWGSRCYAFSAERGRDFLNKEPKMVQKLEFDYEQIKKMGGKYIISSSKINTNLNIKLVNYFIDKEYYWNIYLYKII